MNGRTYSLEPRDRTGVFLGMTGTELALVGGSLFLSIFLRLGGVPGFAAFTPFAFGFVVAKARLGGQPVREWVPLLAGRAAARATGRHRWMAPLSLLPSDQAAALPPALRGVEIREVSTGQDRRPIAVVCEPRQGRMTAVMTVSGTAFAAADPGRQDGLLAGWGDVLSSFAGATEGVAQIGWSDTASPARLEDHGSWAGEQLATADLVGDPASYIDLMTEVAEVAATHETVVWVTVDGRDVRKSRGRPITRAATQLPIAVENLIDALEAAGLETPGPMTAGELRRLLRARIDPLDGAVQPTPAADASLAERLGFIDPPGAGPMAAVTEWSHTRLDGSYHRTWWVGSWPRVQVPADWLHGFMADSCSRTMTVVHRPIDPATSQSRITGQRSKLEAHIERKRIKDRHVSKAEERTVDAVEELDADLAAGFAEVLYLGLVTVSAATLEDLDEQSRRLEQTARRHKIDLRVLHLRQDVAWAATLPFGLMEPGLLEVQGWN